MHYLYHAQHWAGLLSYPPFCDPKTFNAHRVWTATSFAALAYIGHNTPWRLPALGLVKKTPGPDHWLVAQPSHRPQQ